MPKQLTQDQEDVRVSEELIRQGDFVPLNEVLKEFGYERLESGRGVRRKARNANPSATLPPRSNRRSRLS